MLYTVLYILILLLLCSTLFIYCYCFTSRYMPERENGSKWVERYPFVWAVIRWQVEYQGTSWNRLMFMICCNMTFGLGEITLCNMFLLINVRNYQGLLLGIINLPWSLCVVVLPGVGLSVIKRTCIFWTQGTVSFLRSSFIMHADDQIVNSPYSIACPFCPISNK